MRLQSHTSCRLFQNLLLLVLFRIGSPLTTKQQTTTGHGFFNGCAYDNESPGFVKGATHPVQACYNCCWTMMCWSVRQGWYQPFIVGALFCVCLDFRKRFSPAQLNVWCTFTIAGTCCPMGGGHQKNGEEGYLWYCPTGCTGFLVLFVCLGTPEYSRQRNGRADRFGHLASSRVLTSVSRLGLFETVLSCRPWASMMCTSHHTLS